MYRNYIKRPLDFCIAVALMPFVLILSILVWIAIKIDDSGPLWYMAYRLGKDGKTFRMFKFRSMIVNAPDIRLEDGCTYNAEDDPRVTKVGRFLRKSSIDEIPQLINVLIGQMSLIGPRPDLPSDLELYNKDEQIILTVRPGMTGWNQAVNRNSVGAKEKLQADIYYVNHLSFLLDLKIVWLTVKSIIAHKDVYRA